MVRRLDEVWLLTGGRLRERDVGPGRMSRVETVAGHA